MNETNSPVCERTSDLMAFLYKETNERETREFELHLQQCSNCREELASFGVVRESIAAWRDEALAGFLSTPLFPRKSALAALRQFFDWSPLWLKGAAAFAVVTFCVLAGLVFVTFRTEPIEANAVYTQQDVDRLVAEALAKQEKTTIEKNSGTVAAVDPAPERKPAPTRTARNRRPLSRAEREQLAADLRLLPADDDLALLGDRIND